MNDISRCLEILSVILFADDTNLFYSDKNIDTLNKTVNQELKKIARWLCANKLSLNIKKTHFIIFKSQKRKLNQTVSIKINEQPIELVKYTKFLGVYIDEELSWKHHIDQVVSKISKMTGIMAKVRHYLSLKTLQTIYYTRYGIPVLDIKQCQLDKHLSNQAETIIRVSEKKNSYNHDFCKI